MSAVPPPRIELRSSVRRLGEKFGRRDEVIGPSVLRRVERLRSRPVRSDRARKYTSPRAGGGNEPLRISAQKIETGNSKIGFKHPPEILSSRNDADRLF